MGLVSCGTTQANSKDPGKLRTFQVKGVVQEIQSDGKTAVIRHEDIPGYMKGMTMPFPVKQAKDLEGIKAGDKISFRLLVNSKEGWIDQVIKTGEASTTQAVAASPIRVGRDVEPLQIGDPVPDYTFTNELGRSLRFSAFRGQALAVTFFYTRCPFPNFCPRMTSNFSEVYHQLKDTSSAPKNWHLFEVSFDEDTDTPAVLLRYAKQQNYDSKKWSFLTGGIEDMDAFTEQIGLRVVKSETFGFDHNMRTAVIDAKGKLQKIFIGNSWKPDELAAELTTAARVK